MITVTNNSPQQINAALLAMLREIELLKTQAGELSKELEKYKAKVSDTFNSLDVDEVGGDGKYIKSISETDGKISATVGDLTSVIESGNNQPATSGGVASAISGAISSEESARNTAIANAVKQSDYLYDYAISLNAPQWVKICTFGFRNYGSALELELYSNFTNASQGCHIIKIAYGWTDITVEDIAKDISGIFDKVRVCWNDNNNDRLALYVHYNLYVGNTAYFKIKGTSSGITKAYAPNADPTVYSYYKEFNLGTSGLTVNGQRYVNKIQGNVNANSEVTVSFDDYRTILSLISNDEANYCVLLLDQYRTSPLVIYGSLPSYITITHTQYSQEIKIKNTSNSYLVHYNIN